MSDFSFLQNPLSKKWVILAPRRAKRPDEATGTAPVCPFCPDKIAEDQVVERVPENSGSSWQVLVLRNKFPFAPIHEIVVHSPDHHKSFDELPISQSILVLKVFRERYLAHQDKGQVYIFHNHGAGGGESLPHPHTQIAVIPNSVTIETPALDPAAGIGFGPAPVVLGSAQNKNDAVFAENFSKPMEEQAVITTNHFSLLCPATSQWPDEVWILPKARSQTFGQTSDEQIADLAQALFKLIHILDLRHGHEFPFNFYIYPGKDWYLRLIPRQKSLGGFEIGTGVYVNTQNPAETAAFIKEHFENPDIERIKTQQAAYSKHV